MEVTRIRKTSEKVRTVEFCDGSRLRTTASVAAEFSLREGMRLSEAEFEALQEASGLSRAKSRALAMLGSRPLSRRELEAKLLQKGESEGNAASAVQWLEEMGMLDDRQYAGMVARHYTAKGYGRQRVKSELYRRGVDRDFWDEVLDEIPPPDDAIDRIISSRLRGSLPDRRELKKVTDALYRRGFSWDEINSAVRRYKESTEDFEDAD